MNGGLVVSGQSSSSFVPSMIKTNMFLNDDHIHKEFLLWRYRERIGHLSQQEKLSKCCLGAGLLITVKIGQYFMTEDIAEFSQFTDSVVSRECTLPRDEDLSEPTGWIRGNTKIGPVLEVKFVVRRVNVEWKSELSLWTRTILTSWGKDFSWLEQVDHGFEQQGAGNFRNAVRRICVQVECKWFCKPIKGQSKATKTRFCQVIHKNYACWREDFDWCWSREIFAQRLSSVEETDQFSSSW